MGLYRKRPVVIEARRLNADNWPQVEEIATWADAEIVDVAAFLAHNDSALLAIHTLEGVMYAEDGDWVVRGIHGEFYPVKPEIFEATYEPMVRL